MPYSVSDSNLPANVKKLPAKQKRQWVHIWNSTYQDCIKGGGSEKTCESKAFRVANGVLKKGGVGRVLNVLREFFAGFGITIGDEKRATKGWVGSASSYGSTEAYCAACAIDVNESGEKKQSHCMLPYKKGGKPVQAGVEAAAARFNQVKKPAGVSAEKWATAKRAAASKLATAYRKFGNEPPAVLTSAGSRMMPLATRSIVERSGDKARLFSISAVAAKNRVGEIDSRALFDSMVSIARATGQYPQRDFMHYGLQDDVFVTGDVVFMARDGNCLVTVTEYNDSVLAEAEIKARTEQPEVWGDSIAYILLGEPEIVREGEGEDQESTPVLNFGFCRFVATVPEKIAASHFTRGSMEVPMRQEDLDAFALLFGDEEQARSWLEKHVGDVERAIEDAGMMTRTADNGTEPDPIAPDEGELELEVDEELMGELARQAAESMQTRFDELEQGIANLVATVDKLSTQVRENHELFERRFEKLEKDNDEIVEQVRSDMPRKSALKVTYRPRQTTGPEDDGPVTSDEIAEGVLSRLDTSLYPQ